MKGRLINKMTVLIILFWGGLVSPCLAQTNTALQGEIRKSDGSPLGKEKVYLITIPDKIIDSTASDSNGVFRFSKFPYGIYWVGLNISGIDNNAADKVYINALNPVRQNQHYKIDDGSLIWMEENYSSIKDAMENKENVFSLDLNSLQHDVAEKSIVIGTDGSRTLSPKIGELTNLEILNININGINFLPAEIGKLSKLTSLSASLNKLSALPAEMENLKNMRILDLGKNTFTVFPAVITKYAQLHQLNFENNPITELPPGINAFKNLKELNLANCSELTALPVQISELDNLESLDLSGCGKLKSLPDEMIKLKGLKILDVSGTKISTKKFQQAVPGCEVRR